MRLAILLLFALPALADDSTVTHYDLYSKGLRVGSVRTERSRIVTNGQEAVRFDITTRVSVNLLVVRHHLDAHETYVSGAGRPLAYEHTRRENGKALDVVGRREGDRFVFIITEDGATRTNTVRDADYDAVGMEGPELGLSGPGATNVLRVLDLGAASVVTRSYSWIGNEDDLRVVRYADASKSGTRWVRGDEMGLFIARQDGREKSGTYSMRLMDGR